MKKVLNINNGKTTVVKKTSRIIVSMFIVLVGMVVIGLTVYGQLSVNKKATDNIERNFDIFQTEFGEKYKTELEGMDGVEFYVRMDKENGEAVLKVKSRDAINENIVLMHMVYTYISQIIPEITSEKIQIVGYDGLGTFFDSSCPRIDFIQSFCREEYVAAVEKKENLLYNSSVR